MCVCAYVLSKRNAVDVEILYIFFENDITTQIYL